MKHVIDSTDLTVEEIDGILKLAQDIIDDKEAYSEACKGKKLATLFFDPTFSVVVSSGIQNADRFLTWRLPFSST